MSDTTRKQNARENTTREKSFKPTIAYGEQGVLYIDPKHIPEGFQYAWIAEKVLNVEDHKNIEITLGRGWHPVPSEDHPEMSLKPMLQKMYPGRDHDDLIRRGGQVLMRIDRRIYEEKLEMEAARNIEQVNQVDPNIAPGTGPQGMPFFSHHYPTTVSTFKNTRFAE